MGRVFHPLRWQRWAISDLNPLLWPLPALTSLVKARRRAAPPDNPYRRVGKSVADVITAGLDLYRDLRDATMEAMFFQLYGPAAIMGVVPETASEEPSGVRDPRDLPLVQDALAAIGTGGYPEAMALIGALIGRQAGRIPLARLELVDRFIRGDEVLSELPADTVRRIRAEQAVIAELEPERGLQSLPRMLADPVDRQRALALLDEAVAVTELTSEQRVMLDRVRGILGMDATRPRLTVVDGAPREAVAAT
jgi:hypothetical protein